MQGTPLHREDPGLAQDLRTGRAGEQVKAEFPSPQRASPPPQPLLTPHHFQAQPTVTSVLNEENPPRVIQAPTSSKPEHPSSLQSLSNAPAWFKCTQRFSTCEPWSQRAPPHPANRTYRRRAQHTCEFTHVHTHDCHIRRPPVRAPGVGRQHTPPPRPVDLSTKSWTSICTEGLRVHGAGAQLRH